MRCCLNVYLTAISWNSPARTIAFLTASNTATWRRWDLLHYTCASRPAPTHPVAHQARRWISRSDGNFHKLSLTSPYTSPQTLQTCFTEQRCRERSVLARCMRWTISRFRILLSPKSSRQASFLNNRISHIGTDSRIAVFSKGFMSSSLLEFRKYMKLRHVRKSFSTNSKHT